MVPSFPRSMQRCEVRSTYPRTTSQTQMQMLFRRQNEIPSMLYLPTMVTSHHSGSAI